MINFHKKVEGKINSENIETSLGTMTVDNYMQASHIETYRQLPSGEYIGIQRFIFTVGRLYNINPTNPFNFYEYRYCFHSLQEALETMNHGEGYEEHPDTNWILRKGARRDIRNINSMMEGNSYGKS